MALNTVRSKVGSDLIEIVCAPESNTLLHAIGLKAVPHVPCSFSCDGTIRNGVEFMNIGNKFGFSNEMSWLMMTERTSSFNLEITYEHFLWLSEVCILQPPLV